ncbi:2-deoxyglucose-6-phosphate hydrolase YniC [Labilithrix luteola]|uniref:2-deoxyglucose-6-phosphate hydrolase YniC n=1 Tax=Labilithrix luteola TaxID=1391654 RepID=A0A0K1PUN3_9BACT|nr:hexitol phosphatase HxpB [Labilithrix luteola]AKU97235.1 2-deoxyglucose-6-phosphate hydrolase YniC [Labilithrix luteola]
MLRAVIFDMDGLLIDSEPLWVRAEIEVFGDVGVTLSEEDCTRTKGLRTDDVVGYWFKRRPWKGATPKDVETRLIERVASLVRAEGEALVGAPLAFEVARMKGRRLALASSSPTTIIRATLERLGLEDTFDVVRSAETEPYGKPHPGIFMTAAQHLEVHATECLVLEDSLTGLVAAKAARMACITVPFDWPNHDRRFALADATVESLAHVTADLVGDIERALAHD